MTVGEKGDQNLLGATTLEPLELVLAPPPPAAAKAGSNASLAP
jgi:hypothetical protein